MASSFNKVILMGNLTRDPELRVTPSGANICKIGLAVNRSFTGQDGERKEEVTFVDCDAFGKQAETISRWMSKGKGILIEGRLRLDQWEDRQSGQSRSKLGVVIENFTFVGGRGDGTDSEGGQQAGYENVTPPPRPSAPQRPAPQQGSAPRRPSTPRPPQNDSFDGDDVPF